MKQEQINIMIVDDHPLIVDGLKTHLSNFDTIKVVATASNGLEAIAQLKSHTVNVILMDIEMPVMNGLEATKQLVALYPKINIIALSSYTEKALIKKVIDSGAKGFMPKTLHIQEIIDVIFKVHNGEIAFGSDIEIILAKGDAELLTQKKAPNKLKDTLTQREIEIIKLIANGYSNNEIATTLFISPKTVDNHRTNLMSKLNVHNIAGLIRFAIENDI